MDLLNLILFIILANTIPSAGISLKYQNFILISMSFLLGFDQQHEFIWLDGTIYTSGNVDGQSILYYNTATVDGAPLVLDKTTQLSYSNRFISVNRSDGTLRLHMDFVRMSVEDVRVFVDGYQAD